MKQLSFAEGQPETIVEDIENMVRSYVEKVRMLYILDEKHKFSKEKRECSGMGNLQNKGHKQDFNQDQLSKSRKEDSAPCHIISFKELRYQEIKCFLEIVHIIKQIMFI
jgi:hypothetical protein